MRSRRSSKKDAWNEERIHMSSEYQPCDCAHCVRSDDICVICERFIYHNSNESEAEDLRLIKCTECVHTFHIECLEPHLRASNSWKTCNDVIELSKSIKSDQRQHIHCDSHREPIRFYYHSEIGEKDEKVEQIRNHRDCPQEFKDEDVKYFFDSFQLNDECYSINDYVEVLQGRETGVARIVAVFYDVVAENGYVLIEWFLRVEDDKLLMERFPVSKCREYGIDNVHSVLFEERPCWYLQIRNIFDIHREDGKVWVARSVEDWNEKYLQIRAYQQEYKALIERETVQQCVNQMNTLEKVLYSHCYILVGSINTEGKKVQIYDDEIDDTETECVWEKDAETETKERENGDEEESELDAHSEEEKAFEPMEEMDVDMNDHDGEGDGDTNEVKATFVDLTMSDDDDHERSDSRLQFVQNEEENDSDSSYDFVDKARCQSQENRVLENNDTNEKPAFLDLCSPTPP